MKKIVFIGFGRRGKTLYGSLQNRSGIEVAGVFDLDKQCKIPFGIRTYNNISEMLDRQKPDLAVICTPPYQHLESIRTCNEFGTHVLCEKPLVAHALQLKEVANLNIKIYTAYQLNFDALIQKAFKLSGTQNIYSIEASQRVSLSPVNWKRSLESSGGGTLMDNCSHFINLAINYCGLPLKVFSTLSDDQEGIEEQADAILFYEKFNFKIHTDWDSAIGKENRLVINGKDFDIHYLDNNNYAKLYTLSINSGQIWSKRIKTDYSIAKGLERNLTKDPFNTASGKDAISSMLDVVISDLDMPSSKFYETQLIAAIKTNEIISKIYGNKNKLVTI